MSEANMEQVWADQVRTNATAVADGLRRMADEVEREATGFDRIGQFEFSTYGYAAGQVIHAVTWGVANLHLDKLAHRAADADAARARAQATRAEDVSVEDNPTNDSEE